MTVLNQKAQNELEALGLTTESPGTDTPEASARYMSGEYFCLECWAVHDFKNAYGFCAECIDGEVINVWMKP